MPSTELFVIGSVVLFFGCTLSAAGGVGGGGINVPVLLLFFKYSFDTSVSLSLFVVLGNAFAQGLLNITKSHPDNERKSLIWWELVIVLLPAQMGGANIGAVLADYIPTSILYIIALLVLVFASSLSLLKGLKKYHEENALLLPESVDKPTTRDSIIDRATSFSMEFEGDADSLKQFRDSLTSLTRRIVFPKVVIGVLLLTWLAYTVIIVMREALTSKCSDGYFVLFALLYLPLVIGSGWGLYYNIVLNIQSENPFKRDVPTTTISNPLVTTSDLSEQPTKQTTLTHAHSNDPPLDLKKDSIVLLISTFCIGIICNLIGIGGGELLSPLMLSFHIVPQVTSATSASMSCLNTFSSVLKSVAGGDVDYGAGVILIWIGFFGGLTGRQIGLYISKHYGRSSFIIFALVTALYVTSSYYVYELAATDFDLSTDSLC